MPWISFGLNEQRDYVCYIEIMPEKPATAGLMLGMIVEHLVDCYVDQFNLNKEDVSAEIWAALIRTSLEGEAKNQYIHMPVQGDES